ncbi:Xaa-Pro aminopeptidase [Sinimarinibacterium sp. NLF-5-8]|uniref:Xaa-Pro aminopeptidase n=1 Tax=Sinimarinibacterium sp. NLF-5-8 TaxID=2698684 RepID=UPI00137BBD2F|nr:Xaa-Pro aminopeptidase [Sinimarinibacterium sp. NLF-5-8]QHS10125.1 Xaa-Pro aminopeptidase [Sinimarinibacterium sp. NLF-5-8]
MAQKAVTKAVAEYRARRAELMRRIGRDAVAIVPAAHEVTRSRDTHFPFRQDSDFAYLTGFAEPDAIAVLLPGHKQDGKKCEFVLFVRPRDATREIWDGRRAGPEGAVRDYGADAAYPIEQFEALLPQLLGGRRTLHYTMGERAALDQRINACVRQLREVSRRGAVAPEQITALDGTLHEMRLHKSERELDLLASACEISAEAHCIAMRSTRPALYEWQIAAEIHAHFARHDMQPGYTSIVGGGDNACILHYVENNCVLQDGDLLLIDAGGELQGYTADITRTFPVNGRFSAAQQALYEVVLEANVQAIKTLKVGTSSAKPHEVATQILTQGLVDLGLLKGNVKDLIAEGKQRQFYMHGTGHWLGMDVHDVGRYQVDGKARAFAQGMVMTVEPGLYIAPGSAGVPEQYWGIGIRIEDDVVVTDTGARVLTGGVPKTVDEIQRLMAGA